MTERLVEVPETRDERLAALDAWGAEIPTAEPGDWIGDAIRRANAARCEAILERTGSDAPEGSAGWIAARWIVQHRTFTRCRERIAEGDTGAVCLGQMVMAAHEMGRLESEMFWRPGVDPTTGKAREALALAEREAYRGRKEGGQRSKKVAAQREAFAQSLAMKIIKGRNKPISTAELARRVAERWGDGAPGHSTLREYLKKLPARA